MLAKYVHQEFSEHSWARKENGEIDDYAFSVGYCNGPVCERCGASYCVHCGKEEDVGKCIVDYVECPVCNLKLEEDANTHYCRRCGTKIEFLR